jgi:hypothetical protein
VNYAVHPTVFGPRHLAFSRDLAGAVEDALSERLPGHPPVLFLQGALGDVSPRRSGLDGEAALRDLAPRFADLVAPTLLAGESFARLRVRAVAGRQDLGSARAFTCWGSREAFARDVAPGPFRGGFLPCVADLLTLPVNAIPWSLGIPEVRVGFSFSGSVGFAVQLDRAVAGETGSREREVGALLLEAQYAKDGPPAAALAVLWQPGEATQAVGGAWRASAERLGFATPMVLGLVNGSMAYLTTREEYAAPRSYEAVTSLYGPEAAEHVGATMRAALERLRGEDPR